MRAGVMQGTRASLLERLKQPQADTAWEEFYALYWPVIVRYAQKMGLGEADARDVLQETMVTLMRLLPQFQYEPARGLFRNFLLTIVHRKTLAAFRRHQRRREVSLESPAASGRALEDVLSSGGPSPVNPESEAAWQASLLAEALHNIKLEVGRRTFEVFLRYVVEGQAAEEVAGAFGIQKNAVYQVRNRLLKRLQDEVLRLQRGTGRSEEAGAGGGPE